MQRIQKEETGQPSRSYRHIFFVKLPLPVGQSPMFSFNFIKTVCHALKNILFFVREFWDTFDTEIFNCAMTNWIKVIIGKAKEKLT
jgi:hypothetical protein